MERKEVQKKKKIPIDKLLYAEPKLIEKFIKENPELSKNIIDCVINKK